MGFYTFQKGNTIGTDQTAWINWLFFLPLCFKNNKIKSRKEAHIICLLENAIFSQYDNGKASMSSADPEKSVL